MLRQHDKGEMSRRGKGRCGLSIPVYDSDVKVAQSAETDL